MIRRLTSVILTMAAGIALAGLMPSCQSGQGLSFEQKEVASSRTAGQATVHATTQAMVSERLLQDDSRRVLRMSNGFTIILQRNATAPVAACRIYVKAGALTEQEFMGAGISHVLEHLVAGASSGKRKEEENELLLQQIGNDSNAYTDEDQTCYFITTTADKWPVAMDLLIDFTTNTEFTKEQFEREFQVVQREIEMGEAEADRTFYKHTQSNRYLVSPAKYPVIGFKQAFQKLTFEDCKKYYARMYVPDNMVISLAGDIDLDAAEKAIVGQLAPIRRKGLPSIALPPEPNVLVPRKSVSFADVKQARVEWSFPTTNLYSPDLYAMDVLAGALGGGESSLLVRKLRDDLGLVAGVSCSNFTPSYAQGQLSISAMLDPKDIPAAQEALLKALDEVVKNGVPEQSVARAKAQVAADLVYGNQTAEQQASRNAQDFLTTGTIDFSESYVRHIQAVSSSEVLAAARKYIQTERILATALLPLGAKDPFAGTGVIQAAVGEAAIRKTVLKNGMTVLISRNPAAPLASFNLYTMGGLLAENEATNGIGTTMMELLSRGTTTRSHEQVTDFLDGSGTTLAATSGSNSFSLGMQCLKEHEPEAFGLFADLALHPAFAAAELEKIRRPLLAEVDQASEDWWDEGYQSVKLAYYTESPYRWLPAGRTEVISKLSVADVRAHYEKFFLNPAKTILSISGDIDADAAAKWAAQFEAIPAQSAPLNLTSRVAAATEIRHPTDKQSATIMFAYPPGMVITSPDRHALILLQTFLGGYSSPFGSALHDALRGEGLVYTVQAQVISGPAGGMFLISALGEPQNTEKITAIIRKIVADTRAGNIPDLMISAAKDQAITGYKLSMQTIAEKSSSAALDELLGLGYDADKRFPDGIRAVTKADLVRMANKYLQDPIVLITTPDAKKK